MRNLRLAVTETPRDTSVRRCKWCGLPFAVVLGNNGRPREFDTPACRRNMRATVAREKRRNG